MFVAVESTRIPDSHHVGSVFRLKPKLERIELGSARIAGIIATGRHTALKLIADRIRIIFGMLLSSHGSKAKLLSVLYILKELRM